MSVGRSSGNCNGAWHSPAWPTSPTAPDGTTAPAPRTCGSWPSTGAPRSDWREQERRLNALPQFRAVVDGVRVHFAHQPGRGPDPLPIVLVHGWPSGFPEMTKLVPLLADPAAHGGDAADAFHVVVPSLPGFGFSGPQRRGVGYAAAGAAPYQGNTPGPGYDP